MVPDYVEQTKAAREERKKEKKLRRLEAIRRDQRQNLERYHNLSDKDYHGTIGKDLKKKIDEADIEIEKLKGGVAESG